MRRESIVEAKDSEAGTGQLTEGSSAVSVDDVVDWLCNTGLEQYEETFQSRHIDGTTLTLLTLDDLENDIGITSAVDRKRIIAWVQNGFK